MVRWQMNRKQKALIQVNNEKNASISEDDDVGKRVEGRSGGDWAGPGRPVGSHHKPFILLISKYIDA